MNKFQFTRKDKTKTLRYLDWFLFLPLCEKFSSSALDQLVLWYHLHLQAGHLCLNGRVFTANDVREGTPLALHVVAVEPCWWELEPLLLQQSLPLLVQVHLFLPRLHLALKRLYISDEANRLRRVGRLNRLLLQISTRLQPTQFSYLLQAASKH